MIVDLCNVDLCNVDVPHHKCRWGKDRWFMLSIWYVWTFVATRYFKKPVGSRDFKKPVLVPHINQSFSNCDLCKFIKPDHANTIPGWWYTYPSEKIWVRQLGWWHSQLNGKIKFMFQSPPTSIHPSPQPWSVQRQEASTLNEWNSAAIQNLTVHDSNTWCPTLFNGLPSCTAEREWLMGVWDRLETRREKDTVDFDEVLIPSRSLTRFFSWENSL